VWVDGKGDVYANSGISDRYGSGWNLIWTADSNESNLVSVFLQGETPYGTSIPMRIRGNTLYLLSVPDIESSSFRRIVAIDLATWQEKWQFPWGRAIRDTELKGKEVGDVIEHGDSVFLCTGQSISRVSVGIGEILWTVHLGQYSYWCPAISDGEFLYVAAPLVRDGVNRLYLAAFDSSGSETWRFQLEDMDSHPNLMTIADGILFVAGGSRALAVHPLTGHLVWETELEGHLRPPVVLDSMVVVTSREGNAYGLQRTSGTLEWVTKLGDLIVKQDALGQTTTTYPITAPFAYLNKAYVGHIDGTLTELSASGQIRWTIKLEGRPLLGGAAAFFGDGESIYVGTTAGWLYRILLPQTY
jgi:outer membrane protein assembly factor BamB